ncbi:MAG: methyltransferase domain-containing protein [Nitrospirales bacterium]
MTKDPRLDTIPRGQTSRGVHKTIIEYLLRIEDSFDGRAMLDVPCGDGSFISSLRRFFPKTVLRGCDLRKPSNLAPEDFCVIDANHPFSVFPETPFDFIFCISGVMEFDNTLQFFTQCRHHMRDSGLFFVTNDNVAGIRDRFTYFWFGKPKQFKYFVTQGQPSWKTLSIANMVRILQDAGFLIQEIRYVPLQGKDWLWLPWALLIYPVHFLHVQRADTALPLALRQAMHPFQSLLSPHYIIICEKASG